ncbi:unnamed protein product [Lactuca saligna]|uniref:WIYLD domain-containing protein n=1 Tax=Lactuca saligna TaxID=75948 RepID=A0AA35ZPH2_LACSI|nr:unnamed protein product [Lactuca saligna]
MPSIQFHADNTSPLFSNFKHTHPASLFSLFNSTISSSMAPKRKRQTGLTRMDAALDQVSCFGFSRQLIRRTVKNLLKVYGDDGWKLIEEDGYKVVIDFILDEQESEQKQNLLTNEASSQEEKPETELLMAKVKEVSAKDESFEGNNNPALTIHTEKNNECLEDTSMEMDKTAHSSTLHDDHHSPHEFNIQCSENAPDSGPSSETTNAPVNLPVRRPTFHMHNILLKIGVKKG